MRTPIVTKLILSGNDIATHVINDFADYKEFQIVMTNAIRSVKDPTDSDTKIQEHLLKALQAAKDSEYDRYVFDLYGLRIVFTHEALRTDKTLEDLFDSLAEEIESIRDRYNQSLEALLHGARKNDRITHDEFVEIYNTVKRNKLKGSWADPKI